MNAVNLFIPGRDQVNPDWYSLWGVSFGAADLAMEIRSNPRLAERVHAQMIFASEIDVEARFTDTQYCALVAYGTQRERLVRICGLVHHGQLLRESIGKSAFEQLSKIISVDELCIAVGLREFHNEKIGHDIDIAKFDQLVTRSGENCIELWKQSQQEQMRLRIDLFDEPNREKALPSSDMSAEVAAQIIDHVSVALMQENQSLAA